MTKFLTLFLMSGLVAVMFTFGQDNKPKVVSNSNLRLTQIAGKKLFALKKCTDCHTLAAQTEGKLTPVTNRRSADWFAAHVEKESEIVLRQETSDRKRRRVLQDEILALDDYLYQSKIEERKQIEAMPRNVFEGAYLLYQNNCLNCHIIADEGKDIGPNLTQVGSKRDKTWFLANLKNPQQFAPESVMPKFDTLPAETLEKMADYLTTLKK
ncbi:MAG TPA: cbb3-type cytochrome c oxidase subunit II [bacterium]